MFITDRFSRFQSLFAERLEAMLESEALGAFILVLANSLQDAPLRQRLMPALQKRFAHLGEKWRQQGIDAPVDDAAVFEQLLGLDLAALPVWRSHRLEPDVARGEVAWEITVNSLRKLRPQRASGKVLRSVIQPFEASAFHFNKPFLAPEVLWQGDWRGHSLRVLYNKFPFAPWHLLLAFAPEQNLPQVITRESHEAMFALQAEVAARWSGFALGYNSLAAGASVNHLHFQGFVRATPLPIETAPLARWPLPVERFASVTQSWRAIEALLAANRAFNLLYLDSGCYLMARAFQGTVALPPWLEGAGWLDLAGVMTVPDEVAAQALSADMIASGLARLA